MKWLRRKLGAVERAPLPEPEVLRALLDDAVGLPALAVSRALLGRLADDYARTRALAARPLRIALVGSTGAGKSTLLNALAGTMLAREGVDRPTSSEPVAYAPTDAELGTLAEVTPRVVRYLPGTGRWAGQVFVDTPDLNSIAQQHAGAALAVLDQVDAALLVFHRGSVAEARPSDALRPFARRRALLCVVNFADQLGPEAQDTLRDQVARVVQEELGVSDPPPVFVVSALRARMGEATEEDWPRLEAALQDLADAGMATDLRRRNALAVLDQIRRCVAVGVEETDAARVEIERALEAGLEATRPALDRDFRARLEGATSFLNQSVRRMAAGRLTGPVGWGLRLSGWGSGGLAGAALAAQASLPAGLLVAATGAVLDEVQARGRGAAAERTLAAAGDETLDGLARQTLGRARTAAAARGLAPEAAGLPSHPAWVGSLTAARALAWQEISGRALTDAVGQWWQWARFLLVPVVQLPLLALVGHVGYRVARAYWEGSWLPAGYFLNAAVLGGLWIVSGTVGAGLTLSGLAAQLVRSGQSAFGRALDMAVSELRAQVAQAFARPLAAARAVLSLPEA